MAFSTEGAAQGASAGSAAGPWGAAIGAVVGGFFGGSKEQDGPSLAVSGVGPFAVKNKFKPEYSPPLIDLENPVHILAASVVILGGVWAWKRFR